MFSSSKEELARVLEGSNIRQPRNFEERWLLDTENPRGFRVNFRLSEDAFAHLLELLTCDWSIH